MMLSSDPVLVVSPHLDDAVFSCGRLLAACPGSTVVTVFAGTPPDAARSTDWDRQCGFRDAAEAMQARRQEDTAALRIVGAEGRRLDFLDSQYDAPSTAHDIGRALAALMVRHAACDLLLPLGLFHSDHLLAHAAALRAVTLALRDGWRPARLLGYEDAPYRGMDGVLQARLAALAADGIRATPADTAPPGDVALKRRAVDAYASQVPLFGPHGLDDLWRPERFWQLDAAASVDTETAT